MSTPEAPQRFMTARRAAIAAAVHAHHVEYDAGDQSADSWRCDCGRWFHRNGHDAHLIAEIDGEITSAYWIETADQLDAVPPGGVVRSDAGTIAARFDTTRGVVFGDDRPFEWSRLALPAELLWAPPTADREDDPTELTEANLS